jgi:LCP family protein required for cell wall assembly
MLTHRPSDAPDRGRIPLNLSARHDIGSRRSRAHVLKLTAAVAALLAVATLATAVGWAIQVRKMTTFGPVEAQQIQAQLVNSPGHSYNVLIAGVDATSQDQPTRTDTLLFAYVNPQKGRVWLLWIPPNVVQNLPGYGNVAMADAHLYGGAAATIRAVKNLTGLPVSQYAEVAFPAVQRAVDSVGGVWVDVPSSIEDTPAGSSTGRGVTRLDAGGQLLDGSQALILMRAKPPASDNGYERMEDQQMLVDALAGAVAQRTTPLKGLELLVASAPFIRTTMSIETLAGLESAFRYAGSSSIFSATVIGAWKPPYVIPDQATVVKLVRDMRAGRPFDVPSAELAKAAANSVSVAVGKTPSRVTVTVENGSGIPGAAKQAAAALQARGFRIASTGNANQNVYSQTVVIYRSDIGLANLATRYLPPGVKVVRSYGFYAFKTDVLVIVGKDWDISKVPAAPIVTQ